MKRSICTTTIAGMLLCGLAGGSVALARDDAADERAKPLAGVRVHQGQMDVDLSGVALGDVFREIERQAAIRFVAQESVTDQVISEQFRALPIVQGIQRLLVDQDYVIDQAPPLTPASPEMIVRVFGKSSGASRAATPAPRLAEDPEDAAWRRAQQLSELAIDADSATITAAVELAIRDPHAAVRETALEVVEMMEEEAAPVQLVAEVALSDNDPELRIAALDVLDVLSDVHREVVLSTLKQVADDQNEEVQELARDLIEALESDHHDETNAPSSEVASGLLR
jgi:hypothetical protein